MTMTKCKLNDRIDIGKVKYDFPTFENQNDTLTRLINVLTCTDYFSKLMISKNFEYYENKMLMYACNV